MDFQLRGVPLLSRVGADRADQVRTDVDAAIAGWADAALLRVDSRNQVLVAKRPAEPQALSEVVISRRGGNVRA